MRCKKIDKFRNLNRANGSPTPQRVEAVCDRRKIVYIYTKQKSIDVVENKNSNEHRCYQPELCEQSVDLIRSDDE